MARIKKRLDILLVEKGFFESREKAQEAIERGLVRVHGKGILKSSTLIDEDSDIRVVETPKYVSRGGYKLEKALHFWKIDVRNLKCLDIGSSTGGFVDCLLKHGASSVVAIDVGRNQLHEKLKEDDRVIVIENYNARYLNCKDLPYLPDFVTCDVSFISVKKIFPAVFKCFKADTEGVFLIKPQFEAGRTNVRKGVVRNKEVHFLILKDFSVYFKNFGFSVDFVHSPIKGPKGNIEYLCYIRRGLPHSEPDEGKIAKIVETAFLEFG
jgi:23S rRNA (cytidine1920-2'-O)/16S rRNA (cytidine1409-2'-O)-methyltransferase